MGFPSHLTWALATSAIRHPRAIRAIDALAGVALVALAIKMLI